MAAGRTATVHERKTQGRVRTRACRKCEARGSDRIAAPWAGTRGTDYVSVRRSEKRSPRRRRRGDQRTWIVSQHRDRGNRSTPGETWAGPRGAGGDRQRERRWRKG